MAAPVDTSYRTEIRKLRKKLRQIEKLEHVDRDLSDEEFLKIERKDVIRDELLELLTQESDLSCSSTTSYQTEFLSPSYSTYLQETIQEEAEPEIDTAELDNPDSSDQSDEDLHQSGDQYQDGEPIKNEHDKDLKSRTERKRNDKEAEKEKRSDESPINEPVQAKRAKKEEKTVKQKPSQPICPGTEKKNPTAKVFPWRGVPFSVSELEGHNDIILCCDMIGDLLVTGSRDTSVKVWDLTQGSEKRNFGGHTGAVTCICLLGIEASRKYKSELELCDEEMLVVSGSSDCCMKIWGVKSGAELRSIYTYNPITSLRHMASANLLVTTSGGGKLELWQIEGSQCVSSTVVHTDALSSLVLRDKDINLGTCDGLIKVYHYDTDKGLRQLFSSDDVKCTSGHHLVPSSIRCISVLDESTIIYGDEGVNLKLLEWKKGTVRKIRNHSSEFGVSDCVHLWGDVIVSSGYDLDNGRGYVNVHRRSDYEYLCTLSDDVTGRILSMSVNMTSCRWTTVGIELKVWERNNHSSDQTVQTRYQPIMSQRVVDSDVDDDVIDEDDDDDVINDDDVRRHRRRDSDDEGQEPASWRCTIL